MPATCITHQSNGIWWMGQTTKTFITLFSKFSLFLKSKCCPQHAVLRDLNPWSHRKRT